MTIESQNGTIKLPNEDVGDFQIFLRYFHSDHNIFLSHYHSLSVDARSANTLAKLYALAECFTANDFGKDVLECFNTCQSNWMMTNEQLIQLLSIAMNGITEISP
jgi:hypothetical protein